MDEVTIRRWCDLCFAADSNARVETVRRYEMVLRGPNGRSVLPRMVDTCADHAGQLEELWGVIKNLCPTVATTEIKQKAEPVESGGKKYIDCPLCGRRTGQGAYLQHLILVHKAGVTQPKRCPDCKASAATPKGMIFHRQRHGYNYEAELLASAKKGGK